MALNNNATERVIKLFKNLFRDDEIFFDNKNENGCDSIYCFPTGELTHREIVQIMSVHDIIGNSYYIKVYKANEFSENDDLHDGRLILCFF
jgi:hypothetical protein